MVARAGLKGSENAPIRWSQVAEGAGVELHSLCMVFKTGY